MLCFKRLKKKIVLFKEKGKGKGKGNARRMCLPFGLDCVL